MFPSFGNAQPPKVPWTEKEKDTVNSRECKHKLKRTHCRNFSLFFFKKVYIQDYIASGALTGSEYEVKYNIEENKLVRYSTTANS